MKDIILIGGGGHCHSVIDVIELEGKYRILGIIDKAELIGERILGYKFIGSDQDLPSLRHEVDYAFIAIGQIKTSLPRINMFTLISRLDYQVPKIISPRAYVSKSAQISEGTIVMHDSLVNANAIIGKNCIINTKALIEHDSIIGDNSHISTSSVVNGNTNIGKNCFIGSNSIIKESSNIPDDSFIKAGSLFK